MLVMQRTLLLLAVAAASGAYAADAPVKTDVPRKATIRAIEYQGDKLMRIRFSAFEKEGRTRYPLTTLDRSMVEVSFDQVEPKGIVRSLTTSGAALGETNRAIVVVFDADQVQPTRAAQPLRGEIADFISKVPAAYLAIGQVSDGQSKLIGQTTPGQAENIATFQREILASTAEGTQWSRDAALCFAAERFDAWDLSDFAHGDQKLVIIVGPERGPPQTPEAKACYSSLKKKGVQTMDVHWPSKDWPPAQAKGAPKPKKVKGFAHRVKTPLDLQPAFTNVVANLNTEYLLEVEVPEVPMAAQPLKVEVKIAYHDQPLSTGMWKYKTVIPELTPPPPPSANVPVAAPEKELAAAPPVDTTDPVAAAGIALVIAGTVLVAGAWAMRRKQTVACNGCGHRAKNSYSDCPFRAKNVVGSLVVLDGKHAGRTLALLSGDNVIGRSPRAMVPVDSRKISWRRHATLKIEGGKALYIPEAKRGVDRVNGWPVAEPRLLGVGHVIQIGERKLRFEAKPETRRSA